MGYNIHITRKKFHYDEDGFLIEKNEWKEFVDGSHEFSFTGEGHEGLQAVWSNRKENAGKHGDIEWLDWFEGSIYAKNPDESLIAKMLEISNALNAKVQGDDGEVYTTPTEYYQEEESGEEAIEAPKRSFLSRMFGK